MQPMRLCLFLGQHHTMHNPHSENPSLFYCQDCNDKTKCKDYLVDHRRLMQNQTGKYICISVKCSKTPSSFPNQPRLDKHKTCHASEKCTECGKILEQSETSDATRRKSTVDKSKKMPSQMDLAPWCCKWIGRNGRD